MGDGRSFESFLGNLKGEDIQMTDYPPPPADGEHPLTEPTAKPFGVPTSASAPRKKPWSKPTVLIVEDGLLLTESGLTPQSQGTETFLYYPTS